MFVTVGDIDIFYTTAGDGPPCLVPSLAGTPIYERTFTPALQDVMQLIFVELRGNRTATGDVDAITFDTMVDDLDGVRRALALDRVAVLGHSAHSMLALAYGARYPDKTSHVLAIAGAPGMTPAVSARTATYWDLVASSERKRTLALWAGHDQISDHLFGRFWGPQGQFGAFDPEANLPKVVAPTFIGQGVFDFAAPPHAWAGDIARLPNATYRSFERSGHYPQLDERDAFHNAVATWLRAHAR